MQKLVIDIETGEERLVDLTAEELAERTALAKAERERIRAEDADRTALAELRSTLADDLGAIRDRPTRRVLTLILRRLGEHAP